MFCRVQFVDKFNLQALFIKVKIKYQNLEIYF